MQEETEGKTAWHRLGKLLIKLGVFDKAEEIFNVLLSQTTDNRDMTILFNQLALVKCGKGEHAEAIKFYEKTFENYEKTLPPDHLDLAESCINIGSVYEKMNEYSEANSFYEKAIQIGELSLPVNHPTLRQWRKMLKDVTKE
jgi:tetratricopeptide (TPR) repeat protein